MHLLALPSGRRLLNLDLLVDAQLDADRERVTLVFAAPRSGWPGAAGDTGAFALTYTFHGRDAAALRRWLVEGVLPEAAADMELKAEPTRIPQTAVRDADDGQAGGSREKQWAHEDSNLGPHPYQGCALAN